MKTSTTKKVSTKKNTVKKQKFVYIVDLTNAETINDVALAFADAKFKAHLPLNNTDMDAIKLATKFDVADQFSDVIMLVADAFLTNKAIESYLEGKKEGKLKRFWHWLIGKK